MISETSSTIERVLVMHSGRMLMRLGLRRGVGRGRSVKSSSSDVPGVAGISELLSSVEEDAERAGERGASLSISKASSMENVNAERVTRGEGFGCDSKSFSEHSGIIWRVVECEQDGGGQPASDIEFFLVRVRELRCNDARAKSVFMLYVN